MRLTGKVIGIVGGHGKMGSWFASFFEQSGCKVIISDTATRLSNLELVQQAEIVIFSLPIGSCVDVIESLLPAVRAEQLLIDFTSIKRPAVEAMLLSDAEVLGLHPMFGPQISSLAGQIIVACRSRPRNLTPLVENLLLDAGVQLCQSTPEEHDKMMAVIQGLNHFMAVVMADCMRQLGFDLNRSMDFTSPVYRMRMAMLGRILAQDPRLYAEIEIMNPECLISIEQFISSAQGLLGLVKNCDTDGFVDYFRDAATYLGGYKDVAMSESNKIIELLGSSSKP